MDAKKLNKLAELDFEELQALQHQYMAERSAFRRIGYAIQQELDYRATLKAVEKAGGNPKMVLRPEAIPSEEKVNKPGE